MGIGSSFKDVAGNFSDVWHDYTGQSAQSSANKTNIKLQREQRDWEEMMSNTAVQRRQADLEAAGINPLLAAGGTGADVPNVSPARVESVMPGGASQHVQKAVSSAFGIAQMALANSQTRKNIAEANVVEETTPAVIASAGQTLEKLKAEVDLIGNESDATFWKVGREKIGLVLDKMTVAQRNVMYPMIQQQAQIANEKARLGLPKARKEAQAWDSILGTWAAYADRVIPSLNSAIGAGALGQFSKLFGRGGVTAGMKVKGGLPKHITDQMKKGSASRYGSFDKTTGEIYGR